MITTFKIWRLTQGLGRQNASERLQAVKALDQLRHKGTRKSLQTALNDSDWEVRMTAAEALENLGDREAVDSLVAHQYSTERLKAVNALAQLNHKGTLKPLLTALNDTDWDVRMAAIRALGNLGNRNAAYSLEAALVDAKRENGVNPCHMRIAAATALVKLGDSRFIQAIEELLFHDHFLVADAAADALKRLGWQPATPAHRVMVAVADHDAETHPVVLVGDVEGERHQLERHKALVATLAAEGKDAVPALIEVFKNRSGKAMKAAAEALGIIGDPRAVKHLLMSVDSGLGTHVAASNAISRILAVSLAQSSGPQTAAWLFDAIAADAQFRERLGKQGKLKVLEMLGKCKDQRALPLLHAALAENDEQARLFAAKSLAQLGDPQGIEHLIGMLDLRDHLNQQAYDALVEVGKPAVDALIPALMKRDLAFMAEKALMRIGDPRAFQPIYEEFLVGMTTYNRNSSILPLEVIREVGDARCVGRLMQVAKEKNFQNRALISSLEAVLDRAASDLPLEELNALASLDGVTEAHQEYQEFGVDYSEHYVREVAVDCSCIRQRAGKELAKRGVNH